MDEGGLVARARAGDAGAASDLLARHQHIAYSVALRLLGDRSEAEDVAQEALMRAHLHLSELQEHERFVPWLRRIAVNLSLNALRRRRRLRFESLEAPRASGVGHPSAWQQAMAAQQRSPEDEAVGAALLTEVEQALQRLPAEQRVALVLHEIYGYDLGEIAALQGCSLSAVKMRAARGRATLRQLLSRMRATVEEGG